MTRTLSPVPTISVTCEKDLFRVRPWLQGREFDTARAAANPQGKPAIALLRSGAIVAGVVCDDPWLQRGADNICEAILIQREDNAERAQELRAEQAAKETTECPATK